LRRETVIRKLLVPFCATLVAGAGVLSVAIPHKSNCGGNSAALASVHCYVLFARAAADDNTDRQFRILNATQEQREQLSHLARGPWIPRGSMLVTRMPLLAEARARSIVVVCNKPFTNVPERWLGSAPPTHAVGYSDGSTGLISPAEFAALNLSAFVALDEVRSNDSIAETPQ
jgi:hypothetical protein